MELTPEQKTVADQLSFRMEMHMNMEDGGHLQHGCNYKGMHITRVVWTPKKNGQWGKGKQHFVIDQEKTEYDAIGLLNELIKRTLTVNG